MGKQRRTRWCEESHKTVELEPADRGRGKEGVSPSTLGPADVGVSDSSL